MTGINFRKTYEKGLFTYLHVDNISYESLTALSDQLSGPGEKAIDQVIYKSIFYQYLALAEFCGNNLEKYCIVTASPDVKRSSRFTPAVASLWKYNILSDDFTGLGIDCGFLSNANNESGQHLSVFATDSFLCLSGLPEDLFGEADSCCSLFALQSCSRQRIAALLHSTTKPDLSAFLNNSELFVHISVAKQVGFYNSLLIKSKADIEKSIYAFQNILDPSN